MVDVEIQTGLRENTGGLLERFADIAVVDPVSAVLLLVGTLIIFFTMAVFGLLSVGAIAAYVIRLLPTSHEPVQQAQ